MEGKGAESKVEETVDFYFREDGVKVYMLPGEEDEKIEIPVDQLPPVSDIDNALKVLIAPLRFWLYFAGEYFMKDDYESADYLMKEVTSEEAIGHYKEGFPRKEFERYYTAIFAGRAGLFATRAAKARVQSEASEFIIQGERVLQEATTFVGTHSTNFYLHSFGEGLLTFVGGYTSQKEEDFRRRIEDAVSIFITADEGARGTNGRGLVVATIANACAHMALENYKEAWSLMRHALKMNPDLPSWARSTFAIILLHLGQKEAAKAALKDALETNARDSMALALMGSLVWEEVPHSSISDSTATPLEVRNSLLENEKKKAVIREHARSYLVKALEYDSNNLLAKLRLAEVQFGRWTPIVTEGKSEPVLGSVRGTGMLIETSHDISLKVRPGEVLRLGGVWKIKLAVDPAHEPKTCSKTLKLAEPILQALEDQPMFYRDFESSRSLAAAIIKEPNLDTKTLVEAHYLDARAKQASGDYHNAAKAYRDSLKAAKSIRYQFPGSIYGLAQCQLYAAELEKAKTRFQEILSLPGLQHHRESLRAIAHILMAQDPGRVDYVAEATKNLKQVTEMNPNDSEAWLELAQILQKSIKRQDLIDARNAYRKAISMQPLRPPSPELWNNYGAILHRLGDLTEAEEVYLKAIRTVCKRTYEPVTIEAATSDEQVRAQMFGMQSVSIAYNLARVREQLGKAEEAEQMYKDIIKAQPHYTDAYLCLGVMNRNSGKYEEAERWFYEAERNVVKTKKASAEALTFRGLLYESLGKRSKARSVFEKIATNFSMKAHPKHGDPYAMVWLGNYNISRGITRAGVSEKHISGAVSCYKRVLEIQPSNVYAANGMGMALLGQGRIADAKQVFAKVREYSVSEIAPVCLNLAFCHMALGEHVQSVQLYQYVSQKIYNHQNVDVLLQLARAYAVAGRVEEAIKPLRDAIRIDPSDLLLWYDLATVLKSSAVDIAEKSEMHNLPNAKKALKFVDSAIKTFSWLLKEGKRQENAAGEKEASLPFSLSKVRENVDALTADRAVFLRFVRQQEEEEMRKEAERREAQSRILQLREELQEEKRRTEEEAKERFEAEQREAEELQQRLKMKKMEWQEQEEAEKAAAVASAKRVRVVEEEEDQEVAAAPMHFRSSLPKEVELLELPGGAGALVSLSAGERLQDLFGELSEDAAREWDLGLEEAREEKPAVAAEEHEAVLHDLFDMEEEEEAVVQEEEETGAQPSTEDKTKQEATMKDLFGDDDDEDEDEIPQDEDDNEEKASSKRQRVA